MRKKVLFMFVTLAAVFAFTLCAHATLKKDWNDAKSDYKKSTGKKHKPANWMFGTDIGKILGLLDDAIANKNLIAANQHYNTFTQKLAAYMKDLDKTIKKEKKPEIKAAKVKFKEDVEKIAQQAGRELGNNTASLNKWINKTKTQMDDLEKIYKAFLKQKKDWFDMTDERVKLVNQRVDILDGEYKGDEKKAKQDERYVNLGKQLDKATGEITPIENDLDKKIDDMKKSLQKLEKRLNKIKEYQAKDVSDLVKSGVDEKIAIIKANLNVRPFPSKTMW